MGLSFEKRLEVIARRIYRRRPIYSTLERDDLIQQGWLGILTCVNPESEDMLLGAAVHSMFHLLRNEFKHNEASRNEPLYVDDNVTPAILQPETQISHVLVRELHEAIQRLRPKQRRFINLHILQEQRLSRVDLPEYQKNHAVLRRAIKSLRFEMGEYDDNIRA